MVYLNLLKLILSNFWNERYKIHTYVATFVRGYTTD